MTNDVLRELETILLTGQHEKLMRCHTAALSALLRERESCVEPELHNWVKSTLGHGETMCLRCQITNREAAVLGRLNYCNPLPSIPVE